MKQIKKGMTEAVTRDGQKVTQLTWFDGVDDGALCVYGVFDGRVRGWYNDGAYHLNQKGHDLDLLSPEEYEWQWLVRHKEGNFETSSFYKSEDDVKNLGGFVSVNDWTIVYRIEESKREVLTE